MNKIGAVVLFLVLYVFLGCVATFAAEGQIRPSGPSDILVLSGTVTDSQGRGIEEVELTFFLNGKAIRTEKEIMSSRDGGYEAEISFPDGTLHGENLEVRTEKPSYRSSGLVSIGVLLEGKTDESGNM